MTALIAAGWATFWTPSFWLPGNTTWNDFVDTPEITYPKFHDICYPIAYSILIFFIRYLVERYIFVPWGLRKGLKTHKKAKVTPNPVLEQAFCSSPRGNLTQKQLQGLSKQLDWSERQVERWLRQRKQQNRPAALVKLAESGWRLTYYSFALLYGLWALWDKPWFWDVKECWTNFPHQHVDWDIKIYYIFQLSCYWSMLFSQFVDVQRKDFLEMFIHHLVTIVLIVFSYTCNLIRGGSLILIVHDCADVFMEAAKIFKYTKWQRACDICFGLFFIVWVTTRLIIFPGYLMKNFWFEMHEVFELYPAFIILRMLVVALLVLHIVWTYFILKILRSALLSGKTEKDSRSSSSEASAQEDDFQLKTSVQQPVRK